MAVGLGVWEEREREWVGWLEKVGRERRAERKKKEKKHNNNNYIQKKLRIKWLLSKKYHM